MYQPFKNTSRRRSQRPRKGACEIDKALDDIEDAESDLKRRWEAAIQEEKAAITRRIDMKSGLGGNPRQREDRTVSK